MKQCVAFACIVILFAAMGCRNTNASRPGQQQAVSVEEAPLPADDGTAAAAAVRFLDRVELEVCRQSIMLPPLEGFCADVARTADEKAMAFTLSYESEDGDGHGPFSMVIDVSRPEQAANPDPYYPGLDLGVTVDIRTAESDIEQMINREIENALWFLRMADPSLSGTVIETLAAMMPEIRDAIAGLAADYPALQGFKQGAVVTADPEEMRYAVRYERNMGESTRRDPNGALLGPDSILISFYVREYIPMMNRYVRGGPETHVDVPLENLNMEASWNIETHDPDLPDVLYLQIIKPRIEQLKELDAAYAE